MIPLHGPRRRIDAVRVCGGGVRIPLGRQSGRVGGCLLGCCAPVGATASHRDRAISSPEGATVLDIVYVLGIIAVFVLVGLVGKGVEKL